MQSAGELSCHDFHDVTFLPCVRDGSGRYGFSFGAHSADGLPYEAFRHDWCAFRSPPPTPTNFPGPAIYGGVLMNHFGHFVLEAMSRLWFIRERPDLPVLWHWIDLPVPHSVWKSWIENLWRVLGLAAGRHHLIRAPVRCSHVLLPDSGILAADCLHPRQVAALACVRTPDAGRDSHVWLSRSALPRQFGRIEGESDLEAILNARGWTIVQPELLSPETSAGLFATADTVGGFAGSAFHAALLAQSPRATLVIVQRPSVDRSHYDATSRARGLALRYLAADMDQLGPLNAWTTFRLNDPQALAERICAASRG